MKYLSSFKQHQNINEGIFDTFGSSKKNLKINTPLFRSIENDLHQKYTSNFKDTDVNGAYGEHRFYLEFDDYSLFYLVTLICSYDDNSDRTDGNNFYIRTHDQEIANKFNFEVSKIQYNEGITLYSKNFKFNRSESTSKTIQDIFELIENIYFHIYDIGNLIIFLSKTNTFKKYFDIKSISNESLTKIMKKQGDDWYLDVDEFYNVFMGHFEDRINNDPGIDHFEKVFNIILSIVEKNLHLFKIEVIETYIKISRI